MKLESQVCSLELSQKLEELGVKQESLFLWNTKTEKLTQRKYRHSHYSYMNEGSSECEGRKQYKNISAYTVAELGEMLPWNVGDFHLKIHSMQGLRAWRIHYVKVNGSNAFHEDATTEADARAKMLIYLLENKLITL